MWIKESLRLSPSELAGIGVWLSLPWTVKMVFGQLVDSVPIFGSQRPPSLFIGAARRGRRRHLPPRAAGASLSARRAADRNWGGGTGRGRRRDVDRSRAAHR